MKKVQPVSIDCYLPQYSLYMNSISNKLSVLKHPRIVPLSVFVHLAKREHVYSKIVSSNTYHTNASAVYAALTEPTIYSYIIPITSDMRHVRGICNTLHHYRNQTPGRSPKFTWDCASF